MSVYEQRVLPWLIDRGMRNPVIERHRPRIPPLAAGRVLEVGVGAGLNFPYYTSRVSHLFGIEPSDALRSVAASAAEPLLFPVTFIGTGAEEIPLENASVDTIVSTWTLCSIPRVDAALIEMRRVLKPGGRFLFMEHGRAPDAAVARTQDRVAPLLRAVAGCNPNRAMEDLITAAGFRFVELEKLYFDGPRFIAYHYVGDARLR